MCSRRYLAVPDLLQREERSNWNETVEGAWQNEEEEEDSPDNDDTTLTTFPIMWYANELPLIICDTL